MAIENQPRFLRKVVTLFTVSAGVLALSSSAQPQSQNCDTTLNERLNSQTDSNAFDPMSEGFLSEPLPNCGQSLGEALGYPAGSNVFKDNIIQD